MTGTGTQADPFYPMNWSEFVTAIGKSGVYIECPENGVWEMNEMLPEGLRSTISWAGNTVHGNGLAINNLYFNGGYIDFSDENRANDIHRLNFLNMATSGSSEKMFCAYNYYSNRAGGKAYFNNCKISGLISSGTVFTTSRYGVIYLTHDDEKSCSINLKFTGNGTLLKMDSYSTRFKYCNIKFDGDTTASVTSNSDTYEKCYISGKSPWNNLKIYGYDNVLDIEIPKGKTIELPAFTTSHADTSVLNIDKMHGSYKSSYQPIPKYIEVTEAQLSDVAYLQSKGFSIAG